MKLTEFLTEEANSLPTNFQDFFAGHQVLSADEAVKVMGLTDPDEISASPEDTVVVFPGNVYLIQYQTAEEGYEDVIGKYSVLIGNGEEVFDELQPAAEYLYQEWYVGEVIDIEDAEDARIEETTE